MVEFIGLIKVNVVKGTNLAIRDVMTSDPYVILALGHQVSLLLDIFTIFFHIKRYGCVYNITSPNIFIAVCKDTCHQEQPESGVE